MGDRYLKALEANEEVVARNVTTNLFERHIKPVFLGSYSFSCEQLTTDVELAIVSRLDVLRGIENLRRNNVMNLGFKIPEKGITRSAFARRAGPPPRSRHHPVPQGARGCDSRQRRRVQRRGQSVGLLPPEHRHRHGDGGLPDRRPDRRARARRWACKPFYKHFEHDGTRGPNMATVYSDRGFGVRAPVVFYNRCNEAAALLKPGDFDWKAIFGAACAGSTAAASSPRSRRRRRS